MHQDTPVLAVGAVLGDSDQDSMAWSRAIGGLSNEVIALREGVNSPVRLNVVFHVDGRLSPNDFEGVRTGRFDKKSSRLVVQAAISGTGSEVKREVLLARLHEAIDEAERHLRAKGVADGLPDVRALMAKLS